MVQIAGKYVAEKSENLDAHLKAIGLPDDKIAAANEKGKQLEITVDGDKYTFKSLLGERTFVLNQEIDETMAGNVVKSTGTLNGNTFTVSSVAGDGKKGKRIYEFSDDGLTVTLSTDLTDATGKIYYKRV